MERIYRIARITKPNDDISDRITYHPYYSTNHGDDWHPLFLDHMDYGSDFKSLSWATKIIDKDIEKQKYINKTKVEYIQYPIKEYWEICNEKFPTEDDAIDRAKQLLGKKWNKHITLTHYWWNPEDKCYESEDYTF